MRSEIALNKIEKAKQQADSSAEWAGQALADLLGECIEIVEALFSARKVKITTDQAEIFIFKVGAGDSYPEFCFLRKFEQLKKCSKAQLQNWIDLGKEAEIKFSN